MLKSAFSFLKLTAVVLFFTVVTPCLSQNESSQRLFFDMGFALFSDYTASPVSAVTTRSEFLVQDPVTWNWYYPDTTQYFQSHAFHLCSYVFRFRANAVQPTDNLAISISGTPSFQFGFVWENPNDAMSLMALNLPLMTELNFGAGSTFKSDANKGGYIGAGYEFHVSPLIDMDSEFKGKKAWGQPAFAAGYRFWVKETKLAELNLKLGFGKNKVVPPDSYDQRVSSPLSIRIAFLWFMNY